MSRDQAKWWQQQMASEEPEEQVGVDDAEEEASVLELHPTGSGSSMLELQRTAEEKFVLVKNPSEEELKGKDIVY